MARLLVARRGDPARIEEVNDAADPDRDLYVSGALLPGPDAILAGPTFEEWLRLSTTTGQVAASAPAEDPARRGHRRRGDDRRPSSAAGLRIVDGCRAR